MLKLMNISDCMEKYKKKEAEITQRSSFLL